jgi:hypothetical protein
MARMTTLDEIRAMTDEEMNVAIAIEVMGWNKKYLQYAVYICWWWCSKNKGGDLVPVHRCVAYDPVVDLNLCHKAELYLTNTCNLHARFVRILGEMGWGGNPTIPPRQRCEAMLAAVRGTK